MSGTMNPLQSAPPQAAPNKANDPLVQHANIWAAVNKLDPAALVQKERLTTGVTPILGALAGNPKVTSKDVVKAASQAAAERLVSPEMAVQFLMQMPQKPEELRPWLRNLYAMNMTASVHAKAALMRGSA